jgi:hypothetical protein
MRGKSTWPVLGAPLLSDSSPEMLPMSLARSLAGGVFFAIP